MALNREGTGSDQVAFNAQLFLNKKLNNVFVEPPFVDKPRLTMDGSELKSFLAINNRPLLFLGSGRSDPDVLG